MGIRQELVNNRTLSKVMAKRLVGCEDSLYESIREQGWPEDQEIGVRQFLSKYGDSVEEGQVPDDLVFSIQLPRDIPEKGILSDLFEALLGAVFVWRHHSLTDVEELLTDLLLCRAELEQLLLNKWARDAGHTMS